MNNKILLSVLLSSLSIVLIAMNDNNQNNLDAQLLEKIKEKDKKTIKNSLKDDAGMNDNEEIGQNADISQENIFYQKAYGAIQNRPPVSYALILHNHGATQIREEDWQSYKFYLESKKRNENKDL